jgi:hypothetical protein
MRFRPLRALPVIAAAALFSVSTLATPLAQASTRHRMMVWVNEAGVYSLPGYGQGAMLIKTKTYSNCVQPTGRDTLSVSGYPWIEVETSSSPTGAAWMRLDLLSINNSLCP